MLVRRIVRRDLVMIADIEIEYIVFNHHKYTSIFRKHVSIPFLIAEKNEREMLTSCETISII